MLVRAAEIRDSEQQQIFDSLDEIHARLAALDALGTMRKRLSELPDRTEVSVLAERLDETVAKLDAQDGVLASIDPGHRVAAGQAGQAVRPAGRPPRRHGRAHGGHLRPHGRAGRPARRPAQAPRRPRQPPRPARDAPRRDAVLGRHADQGADRRRRAVGARAAHGRATRSFDETGEGLRNLLGDTSVGLHRRLEELAARPAVDPTELAATRSSRCSPGSTPSRPARRASRRASARGSATSSTKLDAALVSGRTPRPSARSWRWPTRSRSGATRASSTRPWPRSRSSSSAAAAGVQQPPPPPRPAARRCRARSR